MRRRTGHWEGRHFLALANAGALIAVGLGACVGGEGRDGAGAMTPEASRRPLSSVVGVSFTDDLGTGATDLGQYVRARVDQVARGTLPEGVQFPLANAATDNVRAIAGLSTNVVVSWLDPLTFDRSHAAPRFGANNDYIAFFGDQWNEEAGAPPQWRGSGTSAWLWVNHESISNDFPTPTTAPTGQHLTLAMFLAAEKALANEVTSNRWSDADLTTYVREAKRQVGGSWFHVMQDPASGKWQINRGAEAVRYDATSKTLVRLTGISPLDADHDDDGLPLPRGVVSGIMSDCSGGQTPWGTVITAEENVQDFYGDMEVFWTSEQKLVRGAGADPGSPIMFDTRPSPTSLFGSSPDRKTHHAKDLYGYLVEIDPGRAPDEYEGRNAAGVGHKKIGAMGRARWENTSFAVDASWKLLPNEPIVMYAGDDRRSGRVYKFVSKNFYREGMTRAETRALLDEGKVYAAHFAGLDNTTGVTMLATGEAPTEASPGIGQWIELGTASKAVAPNAAALGEAGKTVGEALSDMDYNGLGGFLSDDDVRRALFTASAKVGIMELNRPEDVEYNPRDPSGTPRVYVAFTNHGHKTQLDQEGKLVDPTRHERASVKRADMIGNVFAMQEADPKSPGASTTFTFVRVWAGTNATGPYDAANPDNIMIDREGGVWFGTDGNFAQNETAEAIYFLDLDRAHAAGAAGVATPTLGKAFRVVALPSDAEATGPALAADMRTLFVSVQHPGDHVWSAWPHGE